MCSSNDERVGAGASLCLKQRLFYIDTNTKSRKLPGRLVSIGIVIAAAVLSLAVLYLTNYYSRTDDAIVLVDSIGFGVTPNADVLGTLTQGLPDVQRTLNWVHLASRYPVRVRVKNPPPDLFRISESAVVVIRGH